MIIAVDPNTAESIKVQLSNNNDVNSVKLRPGMNILLSTNEPELGSQAINRDISESELSTREGREKVINEIEKQLNHPIQSLKLEVRIPGLYSNVPFTWGNYATTFVGRPVGWEEFRHYTQVSASTETVEISKGNFLDGTPSLGGDTISEYSFKNSTEINQYTGGFMKIPVTSGKIMNGQLGTKVVGVTADMSVRIQ